jgi:hypothetical protein
VSNQALSRVDAVAVAWLPATGIVEGTTMTTRSSYDMEMCRHADEPFCDQNISKMAT